MVTSNIHIDLFLPRVVEICQAHRVKRLYLFGSALTDQFDQGKLSDFDFLVSMDDSLSPLDRGENLLQLWNGLETLFSRPVDLLTDSSLNNPFLKEEIESSKVLIYDNAGEKVLKAETILRLKI